MHQETSDIAIARSACWSANVPRLVVAAILAAGSMHAGADGPILTPMGGCPGIETFWIRNATPLAPVALVYGYGSGPKTIPGGLICAGTVLDISGPQFGWIILQTDSNGETWYIARNLTNRMCDTLNLQAIDLTTCLASNVAQP